MVGDSTNVLVPGTSGSEAEVRDSLIELIGRQPNRVVHGQLRLQRGPARDRDRSRPAAGREVAAVGRSMRRMIEAAREVGYLARHARPASTSAAASDLPREQVLWLATGSQGEPRAALARIAAGQHRHVALEPGDAVIFSSRIIPGNERAIHNLQNSLVARRHRGDHRAGPFRPRLRPSLPRRGRADVPLEQARRSRSRCTARRATCTSTWRSPARSACPRRSRSANGDMVRLAPAPAEVVDEVPTGRLVLENDGLIAAGDDCSAPAAG